MTRSSSALILELLTRGVTFHPRYLHSRRLPCWPHFRDFPAMGLPFFLPDGQLVSPPIRARENKTAFRLRTEKKTILLINGSNPVGRVRLQKTPAGLWESSPSGIPFGMFTSPCPGGTVIILGGGCDLEQARDRRCGFCRSAPPETNSPQMVDIIEALRRWGQEKPVHLFVPYHFRFQGDFLMSAIDLINRHFSRSVSVEVHPLRKGSILKDLERKGVSQIVVDLDAPEKEKFERRCPGRMEILGYKPYRRLIEEGLIVFGKGNVAVRIFLPPQDVKRRSRSLERLAAAGAVPIVIPIVDSDNQPRPEFLEDLSILIQRLSARLRSYRLMFDPYQGSSLPVRPVSRESWYQKFFAKSDQERTASRTP